MTHAVFSALAPDRSQTPDKTPEGFWARRGGEIAGKMYLPINLYWTSVGLAIGTQTGNWVPFAAGLINTSGSMSRAFLNRATVEGIEEFGTKYGASAGFVSQVISSVPALAVGDVGALISNAVIGVAAASDFFSKEIKQKYAHSRNRLFRIATGNLRFIGGSLRLASRIPMIAFFASVGQPWMVGVFALLAVADLASALSKPAMNASQVTRVLNPIQYVKNRIKTMWYTAKTDVQYPAFRTPSVAEVMARVNARQPEWTTAEVMAVVDRGLAAYRQRGTFSRHHRLKAMPLAVKSQRVPSRTPSKYRKQWSGTAMRLATA